MWSYSKALAAIERLGLADSNFRFACYWLALWRDGTPPTRAQFDPSRIPDLLPGVAITELRENLGPICRLSGTAIDKGLGHSITGRNSLDYLPREARGLRMGRLTGIVSGGLSVSRTYYSLRTGEKGVVETIQLPFAGMGEDGSRQLAAHLNWRPHMGHAIENKPGLKLGLPEEFIAVPIA